MHVCDICEEIGDCDCMHCVWGNPCLGCLDYDEQNNICKSNGGCADSGKEKEQILNEDATAV